MNEPLDTPSIIRQQKIESLLIHFVRLLSVFLKVKLNVTDKLRRSTSGIQTERKT